jgi:hypothetical protein
MARHLVISAIASVGIGWLVAILVGSLSVVPSGQAQTTGALTALALILYSTLELARA